MIAVRAENRRNRTKLNPAEEELRARDVGGIRVTRTVFAVVETANVVRPVPDQEVQYWDFMDQIRVRAK